MIGKRSRSEGFFSPFFSSEPSSDPAFCWEFASEWSCGASPRSRPGRGRRARHAGDRRKDRGHHRAHVCQPSEPDRAHREGHRDPVVAVALDDAPAEEHRPDAAVARGLAYAPYADMIWCETSVPNINEAREFAKGIHEAFPGKLLAYNCSPSFNWRKNLDDKTIAAFQEELSAMGYKYQFITLAGIHNMWFNMFELAHAYAQGEGMRHYVEKVQRPEFQAAEKGYTFVAHQQEVGTGYFDRMTNTIQGGNSSVTALTGSTEEDQF